MFAFVVHLRSEMKEEAKIFFPYALDPLKEFEIQRKTRKPYVRSIVEKSGKKIGYIIAIPLSAAEIIKKSGRYAVLEAVKLAQELGCQKVGLGALTKSLGNDEWLIKQPEVTAIISNCNSLPVGIAAEDIKKIIKKGDSLSIIGAYGNIGEALSKILIQDKRLKEIILIGKNLTKLENLKQTLNHDKKVKFYTNIEDAKNSEIIITATNATDAIIKSEHLKKEATVYELSQPRNCDIGLLWERPDIKIIDGPFCIVPSTYDFWWMGLKKRIAFPCMCEAILSEESKLQGHSVGSLNINFIKKITKIAKKYGFKSAPFTSFGVPILK